MRYGTCNKKVLRSQKGFTLVELIVVLAIIGVLSAIAAPTILSKVDEAKKQTDIANAATIAMAVKSEIADGKINPSTATGNLAVNTTIKELLDNYFDGDIPKCKSEDDATFEVYVDDNKISIKVGSNIYYPFTEEDTDSKEGSGGSNVTPGQ